MLLVCTGLDRDGLARGGKGGNEKMVGKILRDKGASKY